MIYYSITINLEVSDEVFVLTDTTYLQIKQTVMSKDRNSWKNYTKNLIV